jgi:hypothetical protein
MWKIFNQDCCPRQTGTGIIGDEVGSASGSQQALG